jgi:hypothetical protein
MEDALAQAKQQADIQRALGGTPNVVKFGTENLQMTTKEPMVANAMMAGYIDAINRWDDEDIAQLREEALETIEDTHPTFQQLNPAELQDLILNKVAIRNGIGRMGLASSGRDVPPVDIGPVPAPKGRSDFERGLTRGIPGIGGLIDRALE